MTYEQKRCEYWEEFLKLGGGEEEISGKQIFDFAFARAYAFGREKETISQEDVEKAAKTYASEVDKNVRDLYGIENLPVSLTFGECAAESFREGANFALGKQEKNAKETVISG